MNTISKMCVAPSLKGKTSTTHVANPSHPPYPPSLGSTSTLGSAPPEGGVCNHAGVKVDLELGGLRVGEVWYPLGLGLPLTGQSLHPSNICSWMFGCGFNPPLPTSTFPNPSPYRPTPPTSTMTSTPPTTLLNPTTLSYTSPTTSIVIKTATGGTKVVAKQQKNFLPSTNLYV